VNRSKASLVTRPLVAPFAAAAIVLATALVSSQSISAQTLQTSQAQGSAPVTIVNQNTNAVPVAGVVTVSGTSNVTVSNNTASTPLFVQAVGEPAQAPYQETIHGQCGVNFCDFDFTRPPAGQRLVLQHISASMIVAPGDKVDVEVEVFPASPTFENIKRMSVHAALQFRADTTSNQDKLVTNEPILLYVDPTDKLLTVHVSYASKVPLFDQYVTLSGYLVAQ
jgi:hypothetical protein